jgi:hypothetical protein
VALVGAQHIAGQVTDDLDVGGKVHEPPKIAPVLADGAGTEVPIELQPAQVLLDGLGLSAPLSAPRHTSFRPPPQITCRLVQGSCHHRRVVPAAVLAPTLNILVEDVGALVESISGPCQGPSHREPLIVGDPRHFRRR